MENRSKGMAVWIALALVITLVSVSFMVGPGVQVVSYSRLRSDVDAGHIVRVTVTGGQALAEAVDGGRYQVRLPRHDAPILGYMVDSGVDVQYVGEQGFSLLSFLLALSIPLLLIGAFIWFIGRSGQGGPGQVLQFGESRARLYTPGEKRVTMADVAGLAEVKEELWEVVDFLRHPGRYAELGARIPKGVLLAGLPGTGKTLLARAVAGEAGVPFFSISGSDFVEMFAGVGASRVRDLFARARTHAPCIIFVDEIDAVARQRGLSVGSGNEEREQTLNQLLVEMDGFSTNEGIIIVAATNRSDVLDPAVLRPGRFDRQIEVDPPDRQGRREILAVHTRGKPIASEVDLDRLAAFTVGFTGADLANLVNEAALLTVRRRQSEISMDEFRLAFERVVAGGPALNRQMSERERFRIAVHEAGHAVVSSYLVHADPVEKVTITPRGRALGYVMYSRDEDRYLHSRSEIRDRLAALLGGRAAEQVILGEISTGASDDLDRATDLARRMVTQLGMDERLGPVSLVSEAVSGVPGLGRAMAEQTAVAVDEAVRRTMTEAYERATQLVMEHRLALQRVAEALMAQESIDRGELEELVAE